MRLLVKDRGGARIVIAIMVCLTLLLGAACSTGGGPTGGKVDDWVSAPTEEHDAQGATVRGTITGKATSAAAPQTASMSASSESIGLAAGGAKDVNNFRENIRNGYLPLPTDVTYEGLFYDYCFDTGQAEECRQLFCPSYSAAITNDPFSGETEYYLSVGLNSGMKESDFARKKLNLVIVLDVSGSMSSSFDSYYYDRFGNRVESPAEDAGKSKMRIATEAVVDLLRHLKGDDRLGIVLFNNNARLAKPLNLVGETDMQAIADHILEVSAGGGTQFSAGMSMATELYDELTGVDPAEYENRIIFLTDAMPNLGETSEQGLLGMTRHNADRHVHTTFIGIGVDFNTELIEYITKIRGANYYSVHSSEQFQERMDDEFEYMVTPLVFDLELTLEADGWEIEKVYGSPEASEATGELMRVNTLFPSKREEGETRGGLILLKLRRTAADASLILRAAYEDRNGDRGGSEATVVFPEEAPEYFENLGIRKGILLSRYADLLKNWMIDEREHVHLSRPWTPRVDDEDGIVVPPMLGRWERQSLPLMVSGPYRELFEEFRRYFEEEMDSIDDDTLQQELALIARLGGDIFD
jgi:Ca-activated chloride channel family protein